MAASAVGLRLELHEAYELALAFELLAGGGDLVQGTAECLSSDPFSELKSPTWILGIANPGEETLLSFGHLARDPLRRLSGACRPRTLSWCARNVGRMVANAGREGRVVRCAGSGHGGRSPMGVADQPTRSVMPSVSVERESGSDQSSRTKTGSDQPRREALYRSASTRKGRTILQFCRKGSGR